MTTGTEQITESGYSTSFRVPDWIEANAKTVAEAEVAAITTIDSSRAPSFSPQLATALNREREDPGGPLLLSGAELVELANDGHFNGYDEVWLFESEPQAGLEAPVRLDCQFGAPVVTDAVAAWMVTMGAIVGVGDDDEGMSFVASEHPLAKRMTFNQ